jgi:hypothetical protein
MADLTRIFGAEMPPCSVKVRCYFRYRSRRNIMPAR